MTITITLSPEQEARLLARAARDGQDAPTAALHTLDAALLAAPDWNDIGPRIDAAYADGPDEEERQFMQAARRRMGRLLKDEPW